MGSPASEAGRFANEGQTQVRLTRGFWLAKTECTQKAWRAVTGANPSHFQGEELPVEQISWNDCQTFIGKLRPLAGGWRFGLPTEAQREYACRAGTTGAYAGDLDAIGWHLDNSGGTTHPVGTKRSNAWGFQDMNGNVWEWCRDAYDDHLPGGTDPEVRIGASRVFRGGSWFHSGRYCRAAFRRGYTPGDRYYFLGFRLAAVPPGGLK
jgi:formylglycine-generating enzyme required for sulfatase activity